MLQADVCELPLADGQFTAVSAIHILEHLLAAERLKAAKEINRLLSPDGLLFVRVFATADMRYGKGSEIEENTFVRGNGINYHYFTKEELVQLFSSLKLINYEELKVEKKYGCRCEHSALFSKACTAVSFGDDFTLFAGNAADFAVINCPLVICFF